jgi:hypothetical protein
LGALSHVTAVGTLTCGTVFDATVLASVGAADCVVGDATIVVGIVFGALVGVAVDAALPNMVQAIALKASETNASDMSRFCISTLPVLEKLV